MALDTNVPQIDNVEKTENSSSRGNQAQGIGWDWIWRLILVLVLIAGGYMRTVGMDWDDGEHLHPDERFLTFVVSSIRQNENPADFFDTDISTMNPQNVGYGFYVYGTLPLFITQAVAEQFEVTGWDMYLVGRYVGAVADILTIFVAYLIGKRLFKKEWMAVIGSAFYAFAVLPIQLSHYFTVDILANFFSMTAIYFAVVVATQHKAGNTLIKPLEDEHERSTSEMPLVVTWLINGWLKAIPYIIFGIFFGLAMACKVSVVPIAGLIALGALIQYFELSTGEQKEQLPFFIRNVALAAVISILVFRIGQPYAFEGPGFFGMIPNQEWINNLTSLRGQANGEVDFPPALQWSRRPITFGFSNLTQWGLGLPLGIWAWISFIWMFVQTIRKKADQKLLMLWLFTALYFGWQSMAFNSMMRYFTQIYVPMGLISVWGLAELLKLHHSQKSINALLRIAGVVVAVFVIVSTAAWGYAFSNIYTRPATRVEASDWYYQNIPAPINLKVVEEETGDELQQLLSYDAGVLVNAESPLLYTFQAVSSGLMTEIQFNHVRNEDMSDAVNHGLYAEISLADSPETVIGWGELFSEFRRDTNQMGDPQTLILTQPVALMEDEEYLLTLKSESPVVNLNIAGSIYLKLNRDADDTVQYQVLPEAVQRITENSPKTMAFTSKYNGAMSEVVIPNIVDLLGGENIKTIQLQITDSNHFENTAIAQVEDVYGVKNDPKGESYTFEFDKPLIMTEGSLYYLDISVNGESSIAIYGTKQANESSWDDVVPLRRDGYDPFSEINGVYRSELNFEMYWDDNEDKRERFLKIMDEADLIMITSSRQWASTTRVPERYPMTTLYYQNLLGCPEGENIEQCYNVALPGMYEEKLGFRLVEVFQSNPNIGSFEINDQAAEEAFTVYDHPKVLLFEKTEDYDSEIVREYFYSVDLDSVIHMIPADVPLKQANTLMLPPDQLLGQQEGGTWSELFNSESILNRVPAVGAIVWYLAILLLGWVMFPITRMVFPGLSGRGYAVSRFLGLLLVALLSWWIGSLGAAVTPLTVWLVVIGIVVLNLAMFFHHKTEILSEVQTLKKYIVFVEVLALVTFMAFLLVRLGNPDLWHPYKGGEKPMDFSYLNAVIKSTTFPPYDPWFAGGYINYYYYGFVIVGMPIKALGIEPAIAYNLVLPTLFSCFALAAFSISYHLIIDNGASKIEKWGEWLQQLPVVGGLLAVLFSLIMGNLGTIKMIFTGLLRLGGGSTEAAGLGTNILAFFNGIGELFQGMQFTFYPGDWYWIPSRALPGNTITEFPYFTFLYADLHAHMIALPITAFVLLWGISFLKTKWVSNGRVRYGQFAISLLVGAVAVGALRPTNTWDMPVYLVLSLLMIGYSLIKNFNFDFSNSLGILPVWLQKIVFSGLVMAAFFLLTNLLYSPFTEWYGQGYGSIKLWDGENTPLGPYLSHWGVQLFILLGWILFEFYDWMRSTPLSALRKFRKQQIWFYLAAWIFFVVLIVMLALDVAIIWVPLPMAMMVAILLLRPGISETKRLVYFLVGTALFLTIAVEVIVLEGDIGRMNTVFKFYLQAWVLLSISSAVGLVWFWQGMQQEKQSWVQPVFRTILGLLLFCGLLYPVLATQDKVTDRMASEAPHTLDGMAYMPFSKYADEGQEYSLAEDYAAIQWMQENIEGSPVIIEGHNTEYRWAARYTIYTGNPSVVGWNWHQRQQRTIVSSQSVTDRVDDVNLFYNTSDIQTAKNLLEEYGASYIVVGKMEQALYLPEGLEKFERYDGDLWSAVFEFGETTIYQVLD